MKKAFVFEMCTFITDVQQQYVSKCLTGTGKK